MLHLKEKFCKECQQTKLEKEYGRRSNSPHILKTHCKTCESAINRAKYQTKNRQKPKNPGFSVHVKKRLFNVINILMEHAKPMSRGEILEKSGLKKNEFQYFFNDKKTKHLFKRTSKNTGRMRYTLSEHGHCSTPDNYLIDEQPQIVKNEIPSILLAFYRLTNVRCDSWAC